MSMDATGTDAQVADHWRQAHRDLVAWVVEVGYPYDFRTDPPIPESSRHLLAVLWQAHDGDGTSLADYRIGLADEGGWER